MTRFITILVRVFAGVGILLGFSICFIEVWYYLDKTHALDLGNLAWGVGIALFSLLVLQLGSVLAALKAFVEALQNLPVFNAFRRRATDPAGVPIPERVDGSDKVEKAEPPPPPTIAGGA
jgi:hypothetical protein